MKTYVNTKLCKMCNGRCCKEMPGCAFPHDFEQPLLESLQVAFKSGNWAIDWWEGDPTGKNKIDRAFYIRPRIKGNHGIYHPAWSGACVFFENGKGCKLTIDERPSNCKAVEPKKDFNCIVHKYNKKAAAIAWIPYHNVIEQAASS
jgi:hypothetical protein